MFVPIYTYHGRGSLQGLSTPERLDSNPMWIGDPDLKTTLPPHSHAVLRNSAPGQCVRSSPAVQCMQFACCVDLTRDQIKSGSGIQIHRIQLVSDVVFFFCLFVCFLFCFCFVLFLLICFCFLFVRNIYIYIFYYFIYFFINLSGS